MFSEGVEPVVSRAVLRPADLTLSQAALTVAESASSKIAEDYHRREHLASLIRGEVPPLVIVSGASGSGKSFMLRELKELGVATPPRLITRPAREGDSENDMRWDPEVPHSLLFAYEKYGERYGFSARDIIRTLRSGQAAAVVCGDVGKIAPLIESISSIMPLVPVVSVRLEVPLSVARQRMMQQRPEAYPGEARLRDDTNREVEEWEKLQVRDLKRLFDLHTVINLTSEEHQSSGYSSKQLKPLSTELLHSLFDRFISDAVNHSAQMATEVIRPINVEYGAPGVSDSLISTLEDVLLPRCELKGVTPVLKGGLAVAIYLNDAGRDGERFPLTLNSSRSQQLSHFSRPIEAFERVVTPDIDFTMLPSSHNVAAFAEILSSLARHEVVFKNNTNKSVFKSNKASASVQYDEELVELDAILTSRVAPEGMPFTFEFNYDSFLNHLRREVNLPGGATVHLVPPEFLIMEKLCAGRGTDAGKLDLSDSVALLITQPLNVNILQRLIALQKYTPEVDSSAEPAVRTRPELGDVAESLRALGISDSRLIQSVVERTLLERQNQKAVAGIGFAWEADALKQLAFVNSLLKSLDKVDNCVRSSEDSPMKSALLRSFDEKTVIEATGALREFLHYHARFQIGRRDLFVKRNAGDQYAINASGYVPG